MVAVIAGVIASIGTRNSNDLFDLVHQGVWKINGFKGGIFNMANRSASASATKAVLIMVVAGTMIFTLPTVMVLTVGMIPTFIAYATDRRKEKYKTVSVGV